MKELRRYYNLIRRVQNWYEYPLSKWSRKTQTAFQFKTRSAITIEVPRPLIREFKEIFMTDVYFRPFSIGEIKNFKTIFDFGANAGYFSLLANSLASEANIYAFEPLNKNYELLQTQIARNPLLHIQTFQMAVSNTDGEIEFFADSQNATSTCASLMPDAVRPHRFKVRTISLESIFDKNKIHSCDFLKMDVEGAEYEIFYHSQKSVLRKIKRIAMEVHNEDNQDRNVDSLKRFLENHNFRVKIEGSKALHLLWAQLQA